MAVFDEQFQQHPVHEILAQLEAAIAQEFKHELDEAAIDNLERLVQSGAFIRTRLDGAKHLWSGLPLHITPSWLVLLPST